MSGLSTRLIQVVSRWNQVGSRGFPGGFQVGSRCRKKGSECAACLPFPAVPRLPGSKKQLRSKVLLWTCGRPTGGGRGRGMSWPCRCPTPFSTPCRQLGRLGAALDPDISDQHHPQSPLLLKVPRSFVALRTLRGCQHVLCRIPTAVRRRWTDFFRVKTRVSVHRLLVDQSVGSIVPPVGSHLPALLLVLLVPRLWWCRLYEDWHRDLMTRLNVGGHRYGAGGRHVSLKVVWWLPQETSSWRIVMGQLWHLTGVGKVIGWGNIEEVRGGGSLDGRLLLLSHAWQLEGDLLLVDAQTPDASLLGKGSLVFKSATLATNKQLRDGGEEVFIEFRVLRDIAVGDTEACLPSQPLTLSLPNVVHRGKDVAVPLGGKAVVAFHTGLMSQPPSDEDRGASCRCCNFVDAPRGKSHPTIVVRRERRSCPCLLTGHLQAADYWHRLSLLATSIRMKKTTWR